MSPALRRRDLLLALSLANLCLLEFWRRIVFATPFLMPAWTWRDLAAAAFNLAWLTAVFLGLIQLGHHPRWGRLQLHRLMFLLPLIVFAGFARRQFRIELDMLTQSSTLLALAAVGGLLLLWAAVRSPARFFQGVEVFFLLLTPFLPLCFAQAAWVVAHQEPAPPLARPLPPGPRRVVWVVFDEMDWRYVHDRQRQGVSLPELERLQGQAITARTALQAGVQTRLALPSLIAGRTVYGSDSRGPSQMLVVYDPDEPAVVFDAADNLFSAARGAGWNVGVMGWFLPYCRLFPDVLTRCYWEPIDTRVGVGGPSLLMSVVSQVRSMSPLVDRQVHRRRYFGLLEEARRMATDRSLGLALLHLPLPHEPPIYDRRCRCLTLFNFRADGYLDNMALADRMLGEVREAMERAGLWDSSTVIVTSDHSLRWYRGFNENTDPRIPYYVKLNGQQQPLVVETPFSALVTRELILAVLRGELQRPEEMARWLEQRPHPLGSLVAKPTAAAAAP